MSCVILTRVFNLIEASLYRTPLVLEARSPSELSRDLGWHHAARDKPANPNDPRVSDPEAYTAGFNAAKTSGAKPAAKDWWEEPRNLREKILLQWVKSNTMEPLPGEKLLRHGWKGDPRWSKWQWTHRSKGGEKTVFHFWKNPQGERVRPKFKFVPPTTT